MGAFPLFLTNSPKMMPARTATVNCSMTHCPKSLRGALRRVKAADQVERTYDLFAALASLQKATASAYVYHEICGTMKKSKVPIRRASDSEVSKRSRAPPRHSRCLSAKR